MGVLKVNGDISATGTISASSFLGNASSATKWATARTITIGNTGKNVDGSKNVSWTLSEIGAIPKSGGTMTGDLNFATIGSWPVISGETYPIDSKGVWWSGSSDTAGIFYRITGGDSGNQVFYLGDDTSPNWIFTYSTGAVAATIHNGGITASNFIGNTNGYTWDLATHNTADTWLFVLNGSKIQHRLATDFCAASGSVNYVKVANSNNVGGSGSFTLNDLAKTGFAAGMIQSSVDNPTGSTKWVHALSMCWGEGSNTDWISQLAFGVENSNGLWYRTNASNCVGKSWKRVLDSSNYSSYALPITGGTLNGNLNVGGKVELWSDGEGGNIRLTSPNGSWWSIDALSNSVLRFIWAESKVPFQFTSDGTISANYFTGTANYANTAGYATTADETNNGRGGSIPWAGSFDFEPDVTSYRSMIATYMDGNNKWWNIISCRHRNGSSDGVSYGMYFKTDLTGSWAHLRWNRQYGSGWQGERYIYDTGNVCISSSNPGNGNFYGQIWLKI